MPPIEPPTPQQPDSLVHGNGSVAHQIIGSFLVALRAEAGYEEIANRLNTAVFEPRLNEAALRAALFGEESL
jgi:hypothetical protein